MSRLLGRQQVEPLPYRVISLALLPNDRAILHQRIAQRFDIMLEQGLIDEVKGLQARYPLLASMPSMRCVGYRQVWQYLDDEFDFATMRDKGIAATRQLAKRQLTWLRGMAGVQSFECEDSSLASKVLSSLQSNLSY